MKKLFLMTVFVGLGIVLLSGCTTLPVYERKSETRMIVIQEKIEDGTNSGTLAPDQSRMYTASLKDIVTDYTRMSGGKISGEDRDRLDGRLDSLARLIDKALTPVKKSDEPEDSFWERFARDLGILPSTEKPRPPTNGEKIIRLQRKIDDGRSSGAFSLDQAAAFQAKMDYIRKEYLGMMNRDKIPGIDEREVISRLLDSLEADLNLTPVL